MEHKKYQGLLKLVSTTQMKCGKCLNPAAELDQLDPLVLMSLAAGLTGNLECRDTDSLRITIFTEQKKKRPISVSTLTG